ncbi:MAG TPA: hypothetical protein VGV69_06260 [Solirubrobacterales bacterium]|nr:hypothetical protein [Solirubrobacterales bacterium]
MGAGADDGEAKGPRYLALRPLYPELQSRSDVEVPELDAEGRLRKGARRISFRDQDVEPWARLLLADVDLFTSTPYAAVLEGHGPEVLGLLSEAKGELAGALVAGLAPVLAIEGDDEAVAAGREAAMRALREGAAAGLAAAYDVSTIIQDDGANDPAPAKVPVPLRLHPPLPLMIEQTAAATHRDEVDPTLEDLSGWTLGATYAHEHAAQDEVLLTVASDPEAGRRADPPSSPPAPFPSSPDLAEELAAYAHLAPQLKETTGSLADRLLTQTDNRKKVLAALESAATLAAGVAEAWARHWNGAEPAAPQPHDTALGESCRFRIVLQRREGKEGEDVLEALTLTLEEGAGPSPGGEPPTVKFVNRAEGPVRLDASEVEPGKQWRYSPGDGGEIALPDVPSFRLELSGFDVAATPGATASLSARRNANLAPGFATNQAFVMSTPTVTAEHPAVPLLEWRGKWRLDGELEQALEGGLKALFGEGADLFVTLNLAYGYKLDESQEKASGPDLITELPVALFPQMPLVPATIAKAVAEAAAEWKANEKPADQGGEWLVSLRVPSGVPSGARPLFALDRLVIPLGSGTASG